MKTMANHQQKYLQEQGVTLLLAVLVLSAVMAISFSLATILFIEMRTSGDLLRSEPALYAAEAVGEEVLFKVKHRVPDNMMTFSSSLQSGTGQISMTTTTTPLTDTQFRDIVGITSTNLQNTANRYQFYNAGAADPNRAGSNYGSIKVTYLNTGNTDLLRVYVCEFDPGIQATPGMCALPDSSYWLNPGGRTLSPGGNETFGINYTKQQELVLFNGSSLPTGNIYVQIEAFAPDGTPKGIPYFNQTVVEINAANGEVNRRIRTIVPNY